MQAHDQTVEAQFDPQAHAYLTSSVHASGPDLAWVDAWLAGTERATQWALDVGCGAGHLSFVLARAFGRLNLVDLSAAMLQTSTQEAARRGHQNVQGEIASAEHLPFGDATFDLVATRFSAHHWSHLPASLAEMRRVLKRSGQLLIIDMLGDESPIVDTHLQTLELLRDPSHVRDHTADEWHALIRQARFAPSYFQTWPLRLEFGSWVARMRTPAPAVDAMRRVLSHAPREVHEGLSVEADGSFTPRIGLFVASAR